MLHNVSKKLKLYAHIAQLALDKNIRAICVYKYIYIYIYHMHEIILLAHLSQLICMMLVLLDLHD